jgi:rRNA pseudouridine-1189 N-methylase Emg1 (Nep1/Mra1 family)
MALSSVHCTMECLIYSPLLQHNVCRLYALYIANHVLYSNVLENLHSSPLERTDLSITYIHILEKKITSILTFEIEHLGTYYFEK